MGQSILTQIIQLLVGGITGIAEGIGSGLSQLVEKIFITTTGEGASATHSLTTFGTLIVVFAGISLAIGLCYLIVHWLGSLGASKRI